MLYLPHPRGSASKCGCQMEGLGKERGEEGVRCMHRHSAQRRHSDDSHSLTRTPLHSAHPDPYSLILPHPPAGAGSPSFSAKRLLDTRDAGVLSPAGPRPQRGRHQGATHRASSRRSSCIDRLSSESNHLLANRFILPVS